MAARNLQQQPDIARRGVGGFLRTAVAGDLCGGIVPGLRSRSAWLSSGQHGDDRSRGRVTLPSSAPAALLSVRSVGRIAPVPHASPAFHHPRLVLDGASAAQHGTRAAVDACADQLRPVWANCLGGVCSCRGAAIVRGIRSLRAAGGSFSDRSVFRARAIASRRGATGPQAEGDHPDHFACRDGGDHAQDDCQRPGAIDPLSGNIPARRPDVLRSQLRFPSRLGPERLCRHPGELRPDPSRLAGRFGRACRRWLEWLGRGLRARLCGNRCMAHRFERLEVSTNVVAGGRPDHLCDRACRVVRRGRAHLLRRRNGQPGPRGTGDRRCDDHPRRPRGIGKRVAASNPQCSALRHDRRDRRGWCL